MKKLTALLLASICVSAQTTDDPTTSGTALSRFDDVAVLPARRMSISADDARDVVKAMEILMPGVPQVYEKSEGTSGFGATMTCPKYQASPYASREEIIAALKDLEWARGVLEKWKKRVKDLEP